MTAEEQQQQEQEQQQKEYVLLSATHATVNPKKLHWVVVEKQKHSDRPKRGKPVDSLCGKRGKTIADSVDQMYDENSRPVALLKDGNYFIDYPVEQYIHDLQVDLDHGYIRHKRKVYDPTIEWELFGQKRVGRYKEIEVTLDLLKSEMWCKKCQKMKQEQYPNL